ncbi:adenylate/guanylate cyclase domain-containing protein [Hasllibacter sp. MH4015]|uniref:adenylate/guanylate cyclase domain-containing protein n=1 Tax=Hasllibacter sp. MH4015 TaxID=2854029 RepID=UPI001CD2A106|nr:adenylate/guanylate cyclase domain-containing protein [Hasllibacter sp. MH4015]
MQERADRREWQLPKRLAWFINYGTGDLSGPELRQRRTLNGLSALIPISGLSYAALYLMSDARGLWPAALVALLFCLIVAWPFIAARNEVAAWVYGAGLAVIVQALLVWMLGRDSGLHLYFLSIPAIAIVCFGTRRVGPLVGLTAICAAALVYSEVMLTEPAAFIRVGDGLLTFLQVSAFVIVTAYVALGVYVGFLYADTAERALEVEYGRSEDLLYTLLPQEIARRLKAEPHTTIADSLPNVAIVFADIANFTPIAAKLDPQEVVQVLNRVFRAFDALADRLDLEKIKTIGDAYMVAAGMPNSVGDPAHRAANMALDMLEIAEAHASIVPDGLQIRIGMHVGPVVAGVIGNRKLFYDVWGETVNVASRMESCSAPGRILLTPAARAQLGDDFTFEKRGETEVKGVGPVETWWLTGRA